jgi:hypothetical protein
MVGGKIKMCCKVQCNGHVVESMGWHGIPSLQDGIKVMREPIITNKGENTYPDVNLGTVSF